MKLHAKTGSPRPRCFRLDNFKSFSVFDPWGGPILTLGLQFEEVGNGPLGEATCQIW